MGNLAQDYLNIPDSNATKVQVGMQLPTSEFKKLPMEEKARIFAGVLTSIPPEEQIAVGVITKNVLNGCCWEFVRSNPDLKRNIEAFKNSKVCSIQKVTYDHRAGIHGYLVYMQMQHLCKLLDEENKGPLNTEDLKKAVKHREEAKVSLIKKIQSGYQGRIGIFCTNDSQTITVDGNVYPAYAVTLKELCAICSKTGYGIKIGNIVRAPEQVLAKEDAVIENLTVAPSSNALFINIASIR